MHPSAMQNAKLFFETYIDESHPVTVVDIGARNVNGSVRDVAPPQAEFIGVDFIAGAGVDVVLEDPYQLPFATDSVDVVTSSSCFEHDEMFWLSFLEIIRILKPDGLFYLNVPANFVFHRFPVDCYRFFPDSGNALAKWGRRSGYNCIVLEHFTTTSHDRDVGEIRDYVSIFLKDETNLTQHSRRVLDLLESFSYGCVYPDFENFVKCPG